MAERTIRFRFGSLSLTLGNRFDVADVEWMKAQGARGDHPFTAEESRVLLDKVIDLVAKCSCEPVTREDLMAALPGTEEEQTNLIAAVAVAFLQLRGMIPPYDN